MDKERYDAAYKEVLDVLRDFRTRDQVTQSQLAAKLGWTQAEISKVENGVRRLDVIELMFWLDALGEDLASFVGVLCMPPPDPDH